MWSVTMGCWRDGLAEVQIFSHRTREYCPWGGRQPAQLFPAVKLLSQKKVLYELRCTSEHSQLHIFPCARWHTRLARRSYSSARCVTRFPALAYVRHEHDGVVSRAQPLPREQTGHLYGTTVRRRSANRGQVFKVRPDGTDNRDQRTFGGTGWSLASSRCWMSGSTLYGTTSGGGMAGFGTVFRFKSTVRLHRSSRNSTARRRRLPERPPWLSRREHCMGPLRTEVATDQGGVQPPHGRKRLRNAQALCELGRRQSIGRIDAVGQQAFWNHLGRGRPADGHSLRSAHRWHRVYGFEGLPKRRWFGTGWGTLVERRSAIRNSQWWWHELGRVGVQDEHRRQRVFHRARLRRRIARLQPAIRRVAGGLNSLRDDNMGRRWRRRGVQSQYQWRGFRVAQGIHQLPD